MYRISVHEKGEKMRIVKEPKNFEEENWMYLSVGYYEGKVILKNDEGELFFLECDENMAPEGTSVPDSIAVTPIEALMELERIEVMNLFG